MIAFNVSYCLLIAQEWNDDYLVWDPAQYDDVQQIILSPDKVWIPDIGIQNRSNISILLAPTGLLTTPLLLPKVIC